MNNCTEYLDLISAFVDGVITDEDKIRLDAHLLKCPRCADLLSAFYEISAAFEETAVCVPDGFSQSVMARVADGTDSAQEWSETQDIPQRGVRKNRVTPWGAAVRYAAAAACLGVIIFAAAKMSGFGQKFIFPSSGNEMAMTGGQAALDTQSDFDAAYMDGGLDMSAGAEYGENAAALPAEAPSPSAAAPSLSAPSGASGAGENRETSEIQEAPEDLSEPELIIDRIFVHKSGNYYAVIDISEELPEILESYEREDLGGVYNIYIPRETAVLLIDSGYEAEILDEDAPDAMVVYTP